MKNCIFATAGHIDHGKTALIKSLTGVDTDRLEEERRRGITIDLGYAHLTDGGITVHFIDVPGHEKLVKNMLAGAGTVKAVMMVIAADESIKPQTVEHYQICRLLGIKQAVIALTKSDLAGDDEIESVKKDIEVFIRDGFGAETRIIPVSAVTGTGIEALRKEIFRIAGSFDEPLIGDIFRLPVDRSFSIRGFGTVVTGSLIQGRIRTDDSIEVFPSRKKHSIRGIQVFNRPVEYAETGQRTALNIPKSSKDDFKRGDILTNADYFNSSKEIEVQLELLDDYSKVIGRDKYVKFYHFSEERSARLLIFGEKPRKGDISYGRLVFSEPLFALPGDRFILRRLNPVETVGGGIVVFNRAGKRSIEEVAAQAKRIEKERKSAVFTLIEEKGVQCLSLKELRAESGIDTAELNDLISELRDEGKIFQVAAAFLYAESQIVGRLKNEILSVLNKFHEANPMKAGLSSVEIPAFLTDKPDNQLLSAVLDELVKQNSVVFTQYKYVLPEFKENFEAEKSDMAARCAQMIKSSGFSPPDISSISESICRNEGMTRKLLKDLCAEGQLVEINKDIYLHSDIIGGAIEELRKRFGGGGEVTIQNFKTIIAASRKFLIPILEFFDGKGLTNRLPNGNRVVK